MAAHQSSFSARSFEGMYPRSHYLWAWLGSSFPSQVQPPGLPPKANSTPAHTLLTGQLSFHSPAGSLEGGQYISERKGIWVLMLFHRYHPGPEETSGTHPSPFNYPSVTQRLFLPASLSSPSLPAPSPHRLTLSKGAFWWLPDLFRGLGQVFYVSCCNFGSHSR